MTEVRVAISQDFFTAFANIPRAKQKKVTEFVSKFRTNPLSSGINYEKINNAANQQYRSVRIDNDYRGIVYQPTSGNVYLMLWVDKHDDAYDWARRHQCEINPETGSLQLYEVHHTAPESAPSETRITDRTPLFQLRDREFLRLGVPEARLDAVKAVTDRDELEEMESTLPVEAFEALLFLAEGLPLDEVMEEYAIADIVKVDPQDLDAALARSGTQRRFHVVEDERELQAMLKAPLEQWRVFLHPSQRRLVERDWNGPVRVLGGAGTGKTVVAMHRARWLVRHRLEKGERLLFTTFTRNLATDIESNLRTICSTDEMKQIEVTNIDAWVNRFLRRENLPANIVYPGSDPYQHAWNRAMNLADGSLNLPDSFYHEEWRRVVLSQRVVVLPDYLKADRRGRGVALARKQRQRIWPVFEEMRLQLHQHGLMTSEDAVFMVLDLLDQGAVVRPYRAAIVDEAQDLGTEALRLIRALVPEGKNDLMVVGDGHQRIYDRKTSLSRCRINIRGRGRKLRINYRTTEQIRRFATAILEDVEVDDLDEGNDPVLGYRSLRDGPTPILKGFDSAEAEAKWVVDEIESAISEGPYQYADICVVARTGTHTRSVSNELVSRDIPQRQVSRDSADDTSLPGVRLANMHRVKGLEFRLVFLVGISEGVVPLAYPTAATQDPVEQRARELNERALLHVAGTRAVDRLYVSWSGEPGHLLSPTRETR